MKKPANVFWRVSHDRKNKNNGVINPKGKLSMQYASETSTLDQVESSETTTINEILYPLQVPHDGKVDVASAKLDYRRSRIGREDKNHVVEIRMPKTKEDTRTKSDEEKAEEKKNPKHKTRIQFGYIDNEESFIDIVESIHSLENPAAIYKTCNPVAPSSLERAKNRYIVAGKGMTTSGDDISWRTELFIDIDPIREPVLDDNGKWKSDKEKKGLSASDEEKELTFQTALDIKDCLAGYGFPEPDVCDSGNGNYLLYRIDLPNNDDTTNAIERLLEGLALKFSDKHSDVDVKVCDPARIRKVMGTMGCKGDDTPDRPHRYSRYISYPAHRLILSLDTIKKAVEDLLPEGVKEKTATKSTRINSNERNPSSVTSDSRKLHTVESVEKMMDEKGMGYRKDDALHDGSTMWTLDACPWADDHSTGDSGTSIFLNEEGFLSFNCFHASCKNNKRTIEGIFGDDVNRRPKNIVPSMDGLDFLYEAPDGSGEKPKKKGHDVIANEWIEANKDIRPCYMDEEMLIYDGKRYNPIKSEALDNKLIRYFQRTGVPIANSVINTTKSVKKIVLANTEIPLRKLPVWLGENPPCATNDIIPYQNGLLLRESKELIPHTNDFLSKNVLTYDYDPNAKCPIWLQFLASIFPDAEDKTKVDEDRVKMLQEYMGYCLTQDARFQKALMLVGKTRGGKGTILSLTTALVGIENTTAYKLDSLGKDFGLKTLVGKQLATVGEFELDSKDGKKLCEALKTILSDDLQNVKVKFKEDINEIIDAKFMIATNSSPRLIDPSGALPGRFLYLAFEESFYGKEDYDLKGKLLAELPGIANWALEGLDRLHANKGKFTLGKYHQKYAKENSLLSSPVKTWLIARCLVSKEVSSGDLPESCLVDDDGTMKESFHHLWSDFNTWYTAETSSSEMTEYHFRKSFLNMLPKIDPKHKTRVTAPDGNRHNGWNGIRLKPLGS